jgi:hypothetical protein
MTLNPILQPEQVVPLNCGSSINMKRVIVTVETMPHNSWFVFVIRESVLGFETFSGSGLQSALVILPVHPNLNGTLQIQKRILECCQHGEIGRLDPLFRRVRLLGLLALLALLSQ